MIHGEFDIAGPAGTYTTAQLDGFRAQGIAVETSADTVALAVPLNVAFGNPDLLHALGVGPVLASLAAERQYKNDEQIRSEEHTSELQSRQYLVCRLLLEKKKISSRINQR